MGVLRSPSDSGTPTSPVPDVDSPRLPDMFSDLAGAVVLVVHAHPDDEVFATGAATIAAKAAGATAHLRLFTGGEGRSAPLTPAALATARRRKEARLTTSTTLLGIDTWAYLTEPGRWTDTPHAPERTISAAEIGDLAVPVAEAIEALRPEVLLTVGADGLTGHPDHIACHRAVAHALAVAAHRPRAALGAFLDRRAVKVGGETARAIIGDAVGSGRVTGMTPGAAAITVVGPPGTEGRRRQALDSYVPGLGTLPAGDLTSDRIGTGDSALLRFVLDASGWVHDRFTEIPARPGSPEVTQ